MIPLHDPLPPYHLIRALEAGMFAWRIWSADEADLLCPMVLVRSLQEHIIASHGASLNGVLTNACPNLGDGRS